MNRFTRQMRLADVGEAGQAKLSAAHVALRTDGFARTVEEAYLNAAGVRVRVPAPASTTRAEIGARRDEAAGRAHDERDSRSPNAGEGSCDRGQNPGMGESDLARCISGEEGHLAKVELGLRHAAARDVADGAYAALVAMREVLGVGPAPGSES